MSEQAIAKKILCATLLLTLFAGCSAGEKIQEKIDEVKADYLTQEVPAAVDNTNDTLVGTNVTLTEQKQAMLDIHNQARRDVNITDDLTWSDTLAQDAQIYADTLANSGLFKHDPKNHKGYTNGPYGENLYAAFPSKPSFATAAIAWTDEKQYYTYGKIGDASTCVANQQCGHYTQIIWKKTSKVGCAISQYKTGTYKDGYVIVCKYKEPGNYIGETPY